MIVTSKWLNAQEEENIVILDARHDLADLEFGRREYNKDHIPGALFIDMATELADLSLEGGGRYPMPSPQKMADMFAKKGINEDSRVVVYDDNNGGMAAGRVWWMLHYLGNDQVALLEDGSLLGKKKGSLLQMKLSQGRRFSLRLLFEIMNALRLKRYTKNLLTTMLYLLMRAHSIAIAVRVKHLTQKLDIFQER